MRNKKYSVRQTERKGSREERKRRRERKKEGRKREREMSYIYLKAPFVMAQDHQKRPPRKIHEVSRLGTNNNELMASILSARVFEEGTWAHSIPQKQIKARRLKKKKKTRPGL